MTHAHLVMQTLRFIVALGEMCIAPMVLLWRCFSISRCDR